MSKRYRIIRHGLEYSNSTTFTFAIDVVYESTTDARANRRETSENTRQLLRFFSRSGLEFVRPDDGALAFTMLYAQTVLSPTKNIDILGKLDAVTRDRRRRL